MKEKIIQNTRRLFNRYFVEGFSGMAKGLFCTLIAGTILELFGKLINEVDPKRTGAFILAICKIAKFLMGAGIGIGIALQLKTHPIVVVTAAIAGMLGSFSYEIIRGEFVTKIARLPIGDPIGAYVVSVISIELGQHISKKFKLALIGIPIFMFLYISIGIFIAYPFVLLFRQISKLIDIATGLAPFSAGIVLSFSMGLLLTMPTSSAAIWVAVAKGNLSSNMLLAGGAACVGCACHMIGFAVASFKENKWRGLLAQGLGTSMLQIPNIMKNPSILYPAVISSIIAGPYSTVIFKLKSTASGGGMGTSGLVGVIETVRASLDSTATGVANTVIGIFVCFILIPVIVSLSVSTILRNRGIIKFGDMKI